jgi:hypothetical protein
MRLRLIRLDTGIALAYRRRYLTLMWMRPTDRISNAGRWHVRLGRLVLRCW